MEKIKPEDNMFFSWLFIVVFYISGLILIGINQESEQKKQADHIILKNYISSTACPPGEKTYRTITGFHGGIFLQECFRQILN